MSEGLALQEDEEQRLRAVRRYRILDTPPDGAFDRVAALAARFFDVPIATVTIVDHDRIWFKAAYGLDVEQIDRDPGLCASAILGPDPYVVTDALADPRTLENPLVRGELGVRFYAAAPITTHDGFRLGTVNVISGTPRQVTSAELATLQDLAGIVADELEVRLETMRTVSAERTARERAEHLTQVLQRRLLPHHNPSIPGLDLATYYQAVSPELGAGGDFFDIMDLGGGRWALTIGDVCGKGPEAAAVTGEVRHMLRALAHGGTDPGGVLRRLNSVLWREGQDQAALSDAEPFERFCTASLLHVEVREVVSATIATAGHPLALLRRTDGAVEEFGTPGQLLGPFEHVSVENVTAPLAPGEMLLLYTDGAVEQHGMSITEGERALHQALAAASGSTATDALASVRKVILDLHHTFDDDVALMLLRVPD